MNSKFPQKIRTAIGLLHGEIAWRNILEKAGENLRSFRLGRHHSGPLFYRHANGFRYAVVPGVPETKEIYLRQQQYEKTEAAVIRQWLVPGDFAVDCGANVGLLSSLMAQRVGYEGVVWAVEASPSTAGKLDAVLAALQLSQVKVIRKAVSDRLGELVFSDDTEHSESNTIQSGDSKGDAKRAICIPATSIEELLASGAPCAPALLKMDIEGAEPLAFKGWASLANSASPPALIFEIYPRGLSRLGSTPADIFKALPLHRYDLWHLNFSWPNSWPEFPCGVPFVLTDPFQHPWPMHSNVIAVPREGTFASRAARLDGILPPQPMALSRNMVSP